MACPYQPFSSSRTVFLNISRLRLVRQHAQAATAAPDGKAAAPAAVFQPAASSALEKKKKGAVIGAAPQLSTEALLAKAKAAKVRIQGALGSTASLLIQNLSQQRSDRGL